MQASTSFDSRAGSFTSSQGAPPAQMMYSQPQQGMMSAYRSFPEMSANSHVPNGASQPSQIYTAVYSGVSVYEMEINNVVVMRRRSDSWLNATQILKVAGVDKGKRTKVLEREILTGEHEKVQGGYGKYQGTWINYRRGREFCRQYGVEELLRPLLEHDMSADGSGQPGQGIETPTKEQAMAANRKRFYTQSLDNRQTQSSGGTFFSNISSTASNAIAAMNKVARLNSPAPRPGSAAQRRSGTVPPQRSSQSMLGSGSQESFRGGSQQSMPSLQSERSFSAHDSAYATATQSGPFPEPQTESQEPPRKKMRPSSPGPSFSQQSNAMLETSMREGSPTEPATSFVYQQAAHQLVLADGEYPTAQPPLPHPGERRMEDKQNLLLDLFADLNRTDFSSHPAITHLQGQDLDLPLDQSANTALHWAATLARVSLMRLLISRGASIFRGNIAGETPLMSAVQVNNNLDHSCFPELLEILAPLIEVRDAKARTILHHIAVASGIKGRAASSKYYLEALLEFLVRSNTAFSHQTSSFDSSSLPKPIGLMRFMSEMVNARDISGNTALNLVARIGNRSIIQQLLEVQADPTIPNYKGIRALDFGVGSDGQSLSQNLPLTDSPDGLKGPSKVEETSKDIVPALTSSLSELNSQFAAELRLVQDRIDQHNSRIREVSAQQKALSDQIERVHGKLRERQERKQKLENLRRAVGEMRERLSGRITATPTPRIEVGDADKDFAVPEPAATAAAAAANGSDSDSAAPPVQPPSTAAADLPSATVLQARLQAYNKFNARLAAHLSTLKARDVELEAKYRKVIALCTNVEEENVDRVLGQLVQAVESEGDQGSDVGRVKEFLRRVEGSV